MRQFLDELSEHGWSTLPFDLPVDDIDTLYCRWRDFFASPSKIWYRAEQGQLAGYFPLGSEKAGGAAQPDQKEFFHYYAGGPCPTSCKAATDRAFLKLKSLAGAALIALNPSIMGSILESSRLVLRISRYCGAENGEYSAEAHSDLNFVTVLPHATSGGLQVCDPQGRWSDVPNPPTGVAVILVGDMLAEASRGDFRATLHRVQGAELERMSLSFFANPELDYRFPSGRTAEDLFRTRSGSIRGV